MSAKHQEILENILKKREELTSKIKELEEKKEELVKKIDELRKLKKATEEQMSK